MFGSEFRASGFGRRVPGTGFQESRARKWALRLSALAFIFESFGVTVYFLRFMHRLQGFEFGCVGSECLQ